MKLFSKLAATLAALALVFTLFACSNGSSDSSDSKGKTDPQKPTFVKFVSNDGSTSEYISLGSDGTISIYTMNGGTIILYSAVRMKEIQPQMVISHTMMAMVPLVLLQSFIIPSHLILSFI